MRISSQFTIVWKRITVLVNLVYIHRTHPCNTDCSSLLVKGDIVIGGEMRL